MIEKIKEVAGRAVLGFSLVALPLFIAAALEWIFVPGASAFFAILPIFIIPILYVTDYIDDGEARVSWVMEAGLIIASILLKLGLSVQSLIDLSVAFGLSGVVLKVLPTILIFLFFGEYETEDWIEREE